MGRGGLLLVAFGCVEVVVSEFELEELKLFESLFQTPNHMTQYLSC